MKLPGEDGGKDREFKVSNLLKLNYSVSTVEPLVATTSQKRPPPLSDRFSKMPKVSKSNHFFWNLL